MISLFWETDIFPHLVILHLLRPVGPLLVFPKFFFLIIIKNSLVFAGSCTHLASSFSSSFCPPKEITPNTRKPPRMREATSTHRCQLIGIRTRAEI